ncbi:MAG: sugar-binding transcriptional regulator [Devosia sp.]|nr:sugar-binding transcriptional regulator [Devosia sp.]
MHGYFAQDGRREYRASRLAGRALSHGPSQRLDEAARAGWLYYVSGDTQEEVARKLRISRQAVQRLVSLCASEGLIKVRLEHPIGRCMELGEVLRSRFKLQRVQVVPSVPSSNSVTFGLTQAVAAEMERWLTSTGRLVVAIGAGRILGAAARQLTSIDAQTKRVVSLTGNIARDGSTWSHDVIFSMSARTGARCFPLPLPGIAASCEERRQLHAQPIVRETLKLSQEASVAFVNIGHLESDARLVIDGLWQLADQQSLSQAGAVGEVEGWAFDESGALIDGLTNDRVAGAPLPPRHSCDVIGVAAGARNVAAMHGALKGRLVNGLITDEETAEGLLELYKTK